MPSQRVYCASCRRWFHLLDTQSNISKAMKRGCQNCGGELQDSEILVTPEPLTGALEIVSGIPFPAILVAPEIETLRNEERFPRDHSERILKLVFGDDDGDLAKT